MNKTRPLGANPQPYRCRGQPKSTLADILKRDADVYSGEELEVLMHD